MWRIFMAVVVAVLLFPMSARCELVGIVAEVAGRVDVQGEHPVPVKPFLRLAEGCRIAVAPEGRVKIVFYHTNCVETWAGPSEVTIGQKGGDCPGCSYAPHVDPLPGNVPSLAKSAMLTGQKTLVSGGGDMRAPSRNGGDSGLTPRDISGVTDPVGVIIHAARLEEEGEISLADELLSRQIRVSSTNAKAFDLIKDLRKFNR